MTRKLRTGLLDSGETSKQVFRRYRSPLRYPGGKQKAIDTIFAAFPQSAEEYREPFVGGGSVYFEARSLCFANKYWINDKFSELISFWKTVQNPLLCARLERELEELRCSFTTVEEIKKYFLEQRSRHQLSEYDQAFLLFFFNRVTFSGTTCAGGFSSAAALKRFTASSVKRLAPLSEALHGTRITNVDFEEVIAEKGKDVFVFLDPPYYTANRLYGKSGSLHDFDHDRLAWCLRRSDHRFLITYDDCDYIRKLYKWAQVENWSLQYGMNNCNLQRNSRIGAELLISNYR